MISHTMKRYAHLKSIYPDRFADGQPNGLCMKKLPVGDPSPFGVLEEHEDWLWVREWNGSAAEERPVYLDRHLKKQIEGYFALMERRPDLFTPHRRPASFRVCQSAVSRLERKRHCHYSASDHQS